MYIHQLSLALSRRGHRVDVVSGPPYPHLPEGVNLVRIPSFDLHALNRRYNQWRSAYWRDANAVYEYASTLSGGFPEPYLYGRRLLQWMRANPQRVAGYDVIHDNQGLFYTLLDMQRQGLPLFNTIHHPVQRDMQQQLQACTSLSQRLLVRRWYSFLRMQKRVASKLQRVVAVSDASAADLCECYNRPASSIHKISNGINQELFRRPDGVTPVPGRIFCLASADVAQKGLRYLLNAMAVVCAEQPNVHAVLLCKPKRDSELPSVIEKFNLQNKIELVWGLDTWQVVQQYALAQVVVVPSLYEGFGLPAVEAMACGAALLTTSGGALEEVVGNAALVVPPADVEAMTQGIKQIFASEQLREKLMRLGRERVERHYSLERMGEAYEAWYLHQR